MSSQQYVASNPQAVGNVVMRVQAGRPWDFGLIAGRVKSLAPCRNIPDRPAQPLFSDVKMAGV